MTNFWHRLFNPHCAHCAEERICKSCDMLERLLEKERIEKQQLLDKLLKEPTPEPVREEDREIKPIQPGGMPWRVRKALLENESKVEARLKKQEEEKKAKIAELEKALEIEDVS